MKIFLVYFYLLSTIFTFTSEPFIPNVDYKNMIRNQVGTKKYTFINNSKFELLQRFGESSLTKGDYSLHKDDFGTYIIFTSKYFNDSSDGDRKLNPPQKSKYYISNDKNTLIIFQLGKENYQNSFQAYSTANYFLKGKYSTSSTLIENKNKPDLYNPDKMSIKYNLNEFWSEGKKGYGIGEKIYIEFIPFEFDKSGPNVKSVPVKLSGVVIFNGVLKSTGLYYKNSRVKELTVKYSNGNTEKIKLKDTYMPQIINLKKSENDNTGVELIINDVYKGSKWDDTCITKILFFGIYN